MVLLGRNQGRTLSTECKARREARETWKVSYGLVLDVSTRIWWPCLLTWAAITENHGSSGLHSGHSSSRTSGGWKTERKVPWLVSEAPLCGL